MDKGFGSYGGNYTNQKPLDISSDSWPTISCENNYVYVSPQSERVQEKPKPPTEKAQSPKAKKPPQKGTAQKKKAPPKKAKPQGKKPQQKKAKPQGEKQESVTLPKPKTTKKKKPQRYVFTQREQNRLRKNRRRYKMLIKRGKSFDEARRILSLKQQRARRITTFVSVAALFVFAFSLAMSYCYYEGAPINEIIIEGDKTSYSDKEIAEAAGISKGQSMLTVHEGKVNDLLRTKLPFISGVNLKYDFPDTLKIDIVSTKEKYIVKNGDRYMCLDKNGKVVSLKKMKVGKEQFLVEGLYFESPQVGETYDATPYILTDEAKEGLSSSELAAKKKEYESKNALEKQKHETVLNIVRLCDKYELMKGGKIEISDINAISVIYDSRVRIFLGSADDLELKISAAVKILEEKDVKGEKARLDMSHDKGIYYFLAGTMDN